VILKKQTDADYYLIFLFTYWDTQPTTQPVQCDTFIVIPVLLLDRRLTARTTLQLTIIKPLHYNLIEI